MKFNIVFWMNSPSPHLAGLIKEVSEKRNVTVVCQSKHSELRKSMGWKFPDFGNSNVLNFDKDETLISLLENSESSINIFSGYRAYSKVHKYFKMAYKNQLPCLIMMENPSPEKRKVLFQKIKYFWFRHYYKRIVGLISLGATRFLKKVGYDSSLILPCAYLSDFVPLISDYHDTVDCNRLLYLGQLEKRKNVHGLIDAINLLHKNIELDIYGEGAYKDKLAEKVYILKMESRIKFCGKVDYSSVNLLFQKYNTVVVPSFYDGWAVVANEALLSGKSLVLSSQCGCSELLSNLPQVYICEPHDINSIKDSIAMATKHKVSQKELALVQKNLSVNGIAEALIEFIDLRSSQ